MINRKILMGLAALVVLAAGLLAYYGTRPAEVAAPPVEQSDVKDFSLGDPAAPVKIVEYASYTCPHCAQFHDTVFGKLKTEYIDTGKVHFTLREVYFDRYGLWAAMIARCGGEMRYFGIHDMIFSQQKEWLASEDPNVVVQNLRTIGLAGGLTNEQLDACLADVDMVEKLNKHFEQGMTADKIKGTPTLIINGEQHPNMTFEDLKAILDAKLAG